MADMFRESRDATIKEIDQAVAEVKESIKQLEEGLITYIEMSNRCIERMYKIQTLCASIGAMAMHWKVG